MKQRGLLVQTFIHSLQTNWSSLETVGDQSAYVVEIQTYLQKTIPAVREALSCSKKFFNHFCHKFASEFIPSLISNTQKCKLMSAIAVEQVRDNSQFNLGEIFNYEIRYNGTNLNQMRYINY